MSKNKGRNRKNKTVNRKKNRTGPSRVTNRGNQRTRNRVFRRFTVRDIFLIDEEMELLASNQETWIVGSGYSPTPDGKMTPCFFDFIFTVDEVETNGKPVTKEAVAWTIVKKLNSQGIFIDELADPMGTVIIMNDEDRRATLTYIFNFLGRLGQEIESRPFVDTRKVVDDD